MSDYDIIELFAGPGGMSEGMRLAGLDTSRVLGIEWDEAACQTARAAGHHRLQGDVSAIDPREFGTVTGFHASPPCFVAGTPVLTRRGSVPIEDVVVGDEVWTHRARWKPVVDTMSRDSEVVTIGEVVCTPDHPFYSATQEKTWRTDPRGYDWTVKPDGWTPADQMQGKFKASALVTEAWGAEPYADPWLLGRYVADGWVGRDGTSFAIGNDKIAEFLREVDGAEAWPTASQPGCVRITHRLGCESNIEADFGKGTGGKTIPTWILQSRREVREDFLMGYLSGDGHFRNPGWDANTVSANLASQLRLLAIGLGYTAQVRLNVTAPTTIIEGRTVRQRDYWTVSIRANDGRYTRDVEGHRWTRQRKAVTPSGRAKVFDITVADDHSFTAWGYIVHNCQGFSMAGLGKGRGDAGLLMKAIEAMGNGRDADFVTSKMRELANDERSALTLEPMRWIADLNPEWVTLEQVPAVLPLWEKMAEAMRKKGYSVVTANLQAEQYGVPQTRKRAVLIASRVREVSLPTPLHSRYHPRNPEKLDTIEGTSTCLPRWVSMAEGLKWGIDEGEVIVRTSMGEPKVDGRNGSHELDPATRPSHTVTTKAGSWVMRGNYGTGGDPANRGDRERPFEDAADDETVYVNGTGANAARRPADRPAPTVHFGARLNGVEWQVDREELIHEVEPRVNNQSGTEFDLGRPADRPSPVIAGRGMVTMPGANANRFNGATKSRNDGIRVTVQEAGILQSFPSIQVMEVDEMSRDEFCMALLAEGHVKVDAEAGAVYTNRGPGGVEREWRRSDTVVGGRRVGSYKVGDQRKQVYLARLIWIAANGAIPDGMTVDHINSDALDDRIVNLQLLTAGDNSRKAHEDGLCTYGAKIPAEEYEEIARTARVGDLTHQMIAETYGVTRGRISQIIRVADYPWQGTKTAQFRQCGDAVPPLLGKAMIEAAVGGETEGSAS